MVSDGPADDAEPQPTSTAATTASASMPGIAPGYSRASVRPTRGRTPSVKSGGVLGVAVLASILTRSGGYGSPETFTDGLVVATWVGAAVVGVGALVALAVPSRRRAAEVLVEEHESVPQLEAA